MKRRGALAMAAAMVLGGCTWATAAPSPDTELTLQPKYLADAPPPPPDRPIMHGLSQLGVGQSLKDAGISITGHVEGSYTWNFADPADDFPENPLRVFDYDHNNIILNQLALQVNRDVVVNKFDIGGYLEVMYGRDARMIHANGLFDHHNDDATPPPNQFDLTQAFLKVGVPVGSGLQIWAGKMVTHMGYEVINPTGNTLYSRSFLFGYAIPFTHTGVMAFYTINDSFSVMGGFSRGWDQANEDNNDALDLLGQLKYTSGNLTGFLNFVTGPEQPDDNGHWRTVVDLIVSYKVSDELSIALNADFGYDSGAAADGDAALWYGVAGYATYTLSEMFSFSGRAEWFSDADGVRTGVDMDLYEITLGVQITPFPKHDLLKNITIRPEVRFDFASEDVFDGGDSDNQQTIAIEVLVRL